MGAPDALHRGQADPDGFGRWFGDTEADVFNYFTQGAGMSLVAGGRTRELIRGPQFTGRADLATFLSQHGIEVERRRIGLDEPIKTLGEFTVPVRLHHDVTAQLKVSVTRE